MEGDRLIRYPFSRIHAFQSTPSAWRETHSDRIHDGCKTISIHSLRMEGDHLPHPSAKLLNISIHSLRMEGDLVLGMYSIRVLGFQSTPSAWRETNVSDAQPEDRTFQSTPSVWRETPINREHRRTRINFNPLPPYGGRPTLNFRLTAEEKFQSTPSVWRETTSMSCVQAKNIISIHSLRMEGDSQRQAQ